jgi:hypothetical protein
VGDGEEHGVLQSEHSGLVLRSYDRLTTTNIAKPAGTSVGTLCQSRSNGGALLAAALGRQLDAIVTAAEVACHAQQGQIVRAIAASMCHAFIDTKTRRPGDSKALYQPATEQGYEALAARSDPGAGTRRQLQRPRKPSSRASGAMYGQGNPRAAFVGAERQVWVGLLSSPKVEAVILALQPGRAHRAFSIWLQRPFRMRRREGPVSASADVRPANAMVSGQSDARARAATLNAGKWQGLTSRAPTRQWTSLIMSID